MPQTTTGTTLGPICFATFLAPNMFGVYRFVADYVRDELGRRTELITGSSFEQFAAGQADIGFLCGLPYVQIARQTRPRSNCWHSQPRAAGLTPATCRAWGRRAPQHGPRPDPAADDARKSAASPTG